MKAQKSWAILEQNAENPQNLGFQRGLEHESITKQEVHGLTLPQKRARVAKCKSALAWHEGGEIIFPGEKIFNLQDSHKQQNDRVYGTSLDDIPIDMFAVKRIKIYCFS